MADHVPDRMTLAPSNITNVGKDSAMLAVVIREARGEITVTVLGPPSGELLDALEHAATVIRRRLRGH